MAAIAPAVFLVLSVVWKGVLPLLICVFGIVLLYHSVILPYSVEQGVVWLFKKPINANAAANMHFALGVGMVGLSMIIAYRPSVLFTRNRPESLESEWSKYPLWKDNTLFTLDFRVDKNFKLSDRFTLQAIVDVFNVTNRSNPKHPETTSLLFNFDGTVQSGLGDPRQAQLGLRLLF